MNFSLLFFTGMQFDSVRLTCVIFEFTHAASLLSKN